MNDSIERTNENNKEPSIRGNNNNNENQEAMISGHTHRELYV
jgi:hypothetical protein